MLTLGACTTEFRRGGATSPGVEALPLGVCGGGVT